MSRGYVEMRNGGYYVAGTRVSLDSIVSCFRGGDAAETIWQNFPSLTLEQVYGAIAFYLSNRDEVDRNIREGEELIYETIPSLEKSRPEVFARLLRAREALGRRS
jgi:uncharacterized protein (DUF433 family)